MVECEGERTGQMFFFSFNLFSFPLRERRDEGGASGISGIVVGTGRHFAGLKRSVQPSGSRIASGRTLSSTSAGKDIVRERQRQSFPA